MEEPNSSHHDPPEPQIPAVRDPGSPTGDEGEPRQHAVPRDTTYRAKATVTQQLAYSWAAPLPDPRSLREYAEILPGLPDRIVSQWEKQSDHRIASEAKVIDSNIKKEDRGQWMGFSVFMAGLIGGIVLLVLGMTPVGLTVFFGNLAAMVTVFLTGAHLGRKQLQDKLEAVEAEQRDLFDSDDDGLDQIESGEPPAEMERTRA